MRISDWSPDVCSSDLDLVVNHPAQPQIGLARPLSEIGELEPAGFHPRVTRECGERTIAPAHRYVADRQGMGLQRGVVYAQRQVAPGPRCRQCQVLRSEEHTSELQSLMRISYAVFCLKK